MFKSGITLLYHNRLAHTSRREICVKCDAQFITRRELAQHKEMVHHATEDKLSEVWSCVTCSRHFSTQSRYDRHCLLHNKEVSNKLFYKCPVCHCNMKYRTLLLHHLKTHAFDIDNGRYQCSKCYKSFQALLPYKQHNCTSVRHEQHQCTYCYRSFSCAKRLASHRRQVHILPDDFIRCPECDQRFRQHGNMVIHRQLFHNRICLHQCKICLKGFASADRLSRHIGAWEHFESLRTVDRCVV